MLVDVKALGHLHQGQQDVVTDGKQEVDRKQPTQAEDPPAYRQWNGEVSGGMDKE